MEEAVEICKLRLFLKLVAQLDDYDQIEPLPDVDFNVRAGNTLVGFTSREEVRRTLSADLLKQLSLPQIEERAEIADRAFRQFRAMQTERGMDAGKFGSAKADLRKRLDELRNELDEYLAGDYGVKVKSRRAYRQWRDSHQPFHWFVEFYGIMRRGGFDVIIGNPPWREISAVKDYDVRGYETERCGNLHGLCTERSLNLTTAGGRFSFIVQLPMANSSRMVSLRDVLMKNTEELYVSPFDDRPGKLFEGLQHCRSVIFIAVNKSRTSRRVSNLRTSRYQRWYADTRNQLFQAIQYSAPGSDSFGLKIFPKYGHLERRIFARMETAADCQVSCWRVERRTKDFLFYQEATQYWTKVTLGLPYFKKNGVVGPPAHGRYVYFPDSRTAHVVCAILNSSIFYAYFIAHGDCFHLSDKLVGSFPVTENMVRDAVLVRLNKKLMRDLRAEACDKTIQTRGGDRITYAEYQAYKSKSIMDEIDSTLTRHYGFTDEELDFIINYDIKYRMGRDTFGQGRED